MPILDTMLEEQFTTNNITFKYNMTPIERLNNTKYTLVTIVTDYTGSIYPFLNQVEELEQNVITACRTFPQKDELLIRLVRFNSLINIQEIHGFSLLSEIDEYNYIKTPPGGMTPLIEVTFESIAVSNQFAKKLSDEQFFVDSVVYIITDGEDNVPSTFTTKNINEELLNGIKLEYLNSSQAFCIGVNTKECGQALDKFSSESGLTFIDGGEATGGNLAKLAKWISKSISSASQHKSIDSFVI